MKAIVYHQYGPPDGVLEFADVDDPVAGEEEAVVQVLGAAVNPGDWFLLGGTPYILRFSSGLRRPRHEVLGLAVAGRVATVGAKVSEFQPGDEVYAEVNRGGFAQRVCVSQDALAPKPAGLSFEQAAAVPVVGVTALQALRDIGQVQSGQRTLITGTSGGVGSFAVQIAKVFGAEVTGVCSTANVGWFIRSEPTTGSTTPGKTSRPAEPATT